MPTLNNEITTKLLLFSTIDFLTEKLNILCLDTFKWTSVLHRGHGSNTSHHSIVFVVERHCCNTFSTEVGVISIKLASVIKSGSRIAL